MATLDDSPSQYPGISWSSWAEIAELNHKDEPEEEEPPDLKADSDSMKLKRQEMCLYGLCPARDEVFLVVCEKCGKVVKPQALQRHMEIRHGHTSPSKSKRSSSGSNASSSSSSSSKCKSSRSSGSSRHKNHTNPVVKVERMSSDAVRQKLNNKKSAQLGYDTERPRPPEKLGISLDSEEVKQLLAITPDDPMPSCASSSLISINNDFATAAQSASTKTAQVITLDNDDEFPKRTAQGDSGAVVKEETITLGNILDNVSVPCSSSSSSSTCYQEVQFNPLQTVTFDALKDIFEPSSIKQEQHSAASSKVASPASVSAPPPVAPPTPPASVESKPQEITLKLESYNSDQPLIKFEQSPVSSYSTQYKVELASNNNLTTSSLKSTTPSSAIASAPATPSMLSVTSSVTLTTMAASPVTTATTLVVSCRSASPATAPLSSTSSSSSSVLSAIRQPTPLTTLPSVSSSHAKTKDPRFLPCKDRIYDAEKHCGVWIEESQRHCTRSLTCKTHALSLRRNVTGRSKSFDQLLLDHRAAKELALKAKQEAVAAAASRGQPCLLGASPSPNTSPAAAAAATISPATTVTSISPATPSHLHTPTATTPTARPLHSTSIAAGKLFKATTIQPSSSSSTSAAASSAAKLTSQLYKPSVPPVFVEHGAEGIPLSECPPPPSSSRVSSDGEDGDDNDSHMPNYISYHPRPAAVNGFGGWHHGAGCYKFHRREDLFRSAFAAAVDRHLHPPPHKKLCVESKLSSSGQSAGLQQHQQQLRDPYDFVVAAGPSNDPPLPPNTLANAAALQAANTALALANKAAAKSLAKSSKPPMSAAAALSAANLQHRSLKLNSNMRPVSSAAGVVTSNAKIGALTAAASAASALQPVTAPSTPTSSSKRKRSASSGGATNHHHHQQQQQQQQQPISIAIPAGQFSATLSAATAAGKMAPNAQGKFNSNILNRGDLNIVVSDSNSVGGAAGVMNGQLVSIPGVTHHIQLNALTAAAAAAATQDKGNKNKVGAGGLRGFPAAGRGAVPVTALNSTASSLMGGNTAALLEQQRGGGLTLTMVTSATLFTNNPSVVTSSSGGAASSAGALLPPNGVLNAQALSQLKGFPISINHIPGLQPAAPRTNNDANKLLHNQHQGVKQQHQQHQQQSGGRCASNGAAVSSKAATAGGVTLAAGAGLRASVPLSAQQLAAAIQLGNAAGGTPRFMPPHLLQQAAATLAPLHIHPQQQQQNNANSKKMNNKLHPQQQQQQQPVSLTIVTPASGAAGTHQTLLLQQQPPPPPPQAHTQSARDNPPPAEPQLLS